MRLKFKYLDTILTYTILIIVCFIFFFPCLWLILSSFSNTGSIYDFDGFFPKGYSLYGFKQLFTDTTLYDYPKWLVNTLIVASGSAICGTILTMLTAYTISRFEFRGRKLLMKTTLLLNMFPSFMGVTAVYLLMNRFHLINNILGLVLINASLSPMSYLVQKGYFDTLNTSVFEAARIDGATNLKVFTKITIPLAKPMIVYTGLTTFTWSFSDFILPSLVLHDRSKWTIAVGLMNLDETEFTRFAAGAVFVAVPIVILYFYLSKHLINGISSGAVKQ